MRATTTFMIAAALFGCDSSSDDSNAGADSSVGGEGHAQQEQVDAPDPTWHGHVAPLVAEKCTGCHTEGGIAPFSLTDYEQAKMWGALMVAAVESGTMPPFLATDTEDCVPRHGWEDDLTLTDHQKAMLSAWVDAGAPLGDPAQAAELPVPPSFELTSTDLSLTIPSGVEIGGTRDQFWCFVLDPAVQEDTWYSAVQVTAGNEAVVHHVTVYEDDNQNLDQERIDAGVYECFGGVGVSGANLIYAWAPGSIPNHLPEGVAARLLPDTHIIMQVHYHPTGGEAELDDSTRIEFQYFEGTPEYEAEITLLGNYPRPAAYGGLLPGPNDRGQIEFMIPAGADAHTETLLYQFSPSWPAEMKVFGMGTHMHYVGTDMQVHLERYAPAAGEPDQECLIHTPKWDFNWQRGYLYDAPLDEVPVIRPGDTLKIKCEFDNSLDNPFVIEALEDQGLDEPQDVFIGEETLDEMCLAAVVYATPYVEEEPPAE